MDELKSEFLFELSATLNTDSHQIGDGGRGTRRISTRQRRLIAAQHGSGCRGRTLRLEARRVGRHAPEIADLVPRGHCGPQPQDQRPLRSWRSSGS